MVTDFKKKRKLDPVKSFLIACAAVLVLIVCLGLIVWDIKIYQQKQKLDSDISALQQKIKNLQNSNDNLKQNISQADDPRYIEKTAREELDLQKPGENVVSFVITQDKSQSKSNSNKNSNNNLWLGWIGGAWSGIKNFLGLK